MSIKSNSMRKVAFSSAIGTMVEYYDFTLYTTATALVFNRIFFPSENPLIGSLSAFATYFVGYCARPLGGILFGHFGDKIGRKFSLLITLVIMGLGTFAIGLIPSYESIGILAPILLIILRCLQGIGIGGEYGGGMTMMVEHAPENKRGFYSSLVHIGVPSGFLIPIIFIAFLSSVLTDEQFISWGWRIPFLLSIVLLFLGIFIRTHIEESPEFSNMVEKGEKVKIPFIIAIKNHTKDIICGIFAKIAESGLFNIYAVFAITYCVNVLHLSSQMILYGVLLGCFLECFTLPFFGALSDRIGRRKVYVFGMIFQAILAVPFFFMLNSGNIVLIYIAIALGLALGHGSVYGAQGAFFSALFPAKIRYSGLSLVQQIGPILGGGISPMVATALLLTYDSVYPIIGYMVFIALFSAICSMLLTYDKK